MVSVIGCIDLWTPPIEIVYKKILITYMRQCIYTIIAAFSFFPFNNFLSHINLIFVIPPRPPPNWCDYQSAFEYTPLLNAHKRIYHYY